MARIDWIVFVAFVSVAVALCGLVWSKIRVHKNPPIVAKAVEPSALWRDCTEFRGNVNAPFTLVAFTDYACQFSRHASKELNGILADAHGKLRLCVRPFPLHPTGPAMQLAEYAELARKSGAFWQV